MSANCVMCGKPRIVSSERRLYPSVLTPAIIAKNASVGEDTMQKDIADTEAEIAELEREIGDRRSFVNFLNLLLAARPTTPTTTQPESERLTDGDPSAPDMDKLLRFAGQAIADARIEEIGDWDGAEIQDALESSGLIERRNRVTPCRPDDEACRCLEYVGRGETVECFPLTILGHEAVAVYRKWQDAARQGGSERGGER